MKKFSEYVKNNNQKTQTSKNEQNCTVNKSAFDLLKSVAGKYEGASEQELLAAIFQEAAKSRKNGELSDTEIDNFVASVSPMLGPIEQKKLAYVIEKIKRG